MLVKYFAYYRNDTGRKEEQLLAPETVGVLLRQLARRYGKSMRVKLLSPDGESLGPDAIVLINGRNISHIDQLNSPLSDTDIVSIFPIVAGG